VYKLQYIDGTIRVSGELPRHPLSLICKLPSKRNDDYKLCSYKILNFLTEGVS